jgi:hypothetical protein
MLQSVLGSVRYDYLSGPITGGPRFIAWESGVGAALVAEQDTYSLLLRRQVIQPNVVDLQRHAEDLRKTGKQIIEPGSFEAPGGVWSQLEFYRFWEAVITEHANNVMFADGWHLSVGCTYEFLCAVRAGKNTLWQNEESLDPMAAVKLIQDSVAGIPQTTLRLERHRSRLLAMKDAIAFAYSERSR